MQLRFCVVKKRSSQNIQRSTFLSTASHAAARTAAVVMLRCNSVVQPPRTGESRMLISSGIFSWVRLPEAITRKGGKLGSAFRYGQRSGLVALRRHAVCRILGLYAKSEGAQAHGGGEIPAEAVLRVTEQRQFCVRGGAVVPAPLFSAASSLAKPVRRYASAGVFHVHMNDMQVPSAKSPSTTSPQQNRIFRTQRNCYADHRKFTNVLNSMKVQYRNRQSGGGGGRISGCPIVSSRRYAFEGSDLPLGQFGLIP
jgi:hypothetical protein